MPSLDSEARAGKREVSRPYALQKATTATRSSAQMGVVQQQRTKLQSKQSFTIMLAHRQAHALGHQDSSITFIFPIWTGDFPSLYARPMFRFIVFAELQLRRNLLELQA